MAFDVALAEEIWTAKYRFTKSDGDGDSSFDETAARVARAVAAAEAPEFQADWEARFRDAIANMTLIPAGRKGSSQSLKVASGTEARRRSLI